MVSFVTATYRDLRVIETIQSLRFHHTLPEDADIVVVDNAPSSPESALISDFCGKVGARYIPFGDVVGTSPSRNRAISEAKDEWVACFDCHVLFAPGFYEEVRKAIEYAEDKKILFHAVKLSDDLRSAYATHFEPVFRYGMLGIWAYDERERTGRPFEIPGSGFGFFLVRKKDFFEAGGFHPLARGFGGEEICFHEVFRRSGGVVMCAPRIRYWHNFHRIEVPYPLYLYDKVRNYLLWFRLLGWDIDRIKRHFVEGYLSPERDSRGELCEVSPHTLSEQQFLQILESLDLPTNTNREEAATTTSYAFPYSPYSPTTREQGHERAQTRRCGACGKELERDDLPVIRDSLRELGITEDRVMILTLDARWLSVFPHAYYASPSPRFSRARTIHVTLHDIPKPLPNTDVLIWDPPQPVGTIFDIISERLYTWPTIVIAKTGLTESIHVHTYNPHTREHRLDKQTSVLPRLTSWLLSTGRMYTMIQFRTEGQGIAILSRDPELVKHKQPNLLQKARNFLSALTEHLVSGAEQTPEVVFQKRLSICALCDKRNGTVCSVCGCPIYRKARWMSSTCPLGKW